MKTHNQNLKNIPLRLTEEQTANPTSVLDEFFQCYHLSDIRPILWQWLTEVLSSPRDLPMIRMSATITYSFMKN
jgi:hypothetical protein